MINGDVLRGEGDRYLLETILRGDPEGFRQLVDRYSGRLKAFAARRLCGTEMDPEDAVQETFLGLLQSLDRLGEVRSLQAYLFRILRNKVADLSRKRPEAHGLRRVPLAEEDSRGEVHGHEPPARDSTPSHHLRQEEAAAVRDRILADILEEVIGGLREEKNLRDLKILEVVFYAARSNRDAARLASVSEPTVSRVRAAAMGRLSALVTRHPLRDPSVNLLETGEDLTDRIRRTWQDNLLSCLKRSTLGAYLLGTLDREWSGYVSFHLEEIGCESCAANLADLKKDVPRVSAAARERIFESSFGFLKKLQRKQGAIPRPPPPLP